jgi:hypothetical protein
VSKGPRHLVISGLDDVDPHRMSAEARCENYVHVGETTHVHFPFDIAYVDSSAVYREGRAVDVRRDRLAWCLDQARTYPDRLFVVVKDPPPPDDPKVVTYSSSPGWESLLDKWEGKSLPNVFFQENRPLHDEPLETFLVPVVEAWRSLESKYSSGAVR